MPEIEHSASNVEAVESSSHDGLQDYVELPYHGNCRNCHHFHIGRIIRYSPSQRKSTKFNCDKCQKTMFALGGNSTQTSLASILTASTEDNSPSRYSTPPGGFLPCTDNLQETVPLDRAQNNSAPEVETLEQGLAPLMVPQPQVHNPSSYIERNESNTLPNGTIPPRNDIFNSHATQPNQSPKSESASRPQPITTRQSPLQRFSPKTRAQRFYQFVRNHIPKRQQHSRNGSLQTVSRLVPEMKDSSTMTDSPPRRLSRGGSSRVLLSSSMPANVALISHTAHPDEELDELEHDTRIKKERLEAKRREATLRRSTLSARKCFCDDRCHCYRGAGRAAPQSHGSLNPSNVPEHHLGENLIEEVRSSHDASDSPPRHHSPARRVAFIGAHLDDFEPSSDRPVSPSTLDARRPSRISSSTPTSQATTAIESRSSEARMATQSSRRSASLPALPFHDIIQVVEQSRPALLDYLRSLDPLGHPIPDRRIARSEQHQETTEQESPDISVSESLPECIPLVRTSTTSLSHLEVEDEVTTSDLSSSHRTPGGGSSSRTPQIHNPEDASIGPPPLEPDGVAEALEELSRGTGQNTQVTDFGDPIRDGL